ncbi:hypothetical protein E2562_029645 [Oryza meyeriana var. granulata]|uniref:Uncharacterized protein n=1 Tax=Oryza meyeriana var. granulata TaxID=110450 RepID=A0A6G1FDN1_9ORYZ|nr:hypothetical protein E2562_029645 [Oryza meyeriana var. granulata]
MARGGSPDLPAPRVSDGEPRAARMGANSRWLERKSGRGRSPRRCSPSGSRGAAHRGLGASGNRSAAGMGVVVHLGWHLLLALAQCSSGMVAGWSHRGDDVDGEARWGEALRYAAQPSGPSSGSHGPEEGDDRAVACVWMYVG